ncbi:MAG: alpha/beta hydrolase [Proteobacteria bacterium]|nr:alpha/beta hydrolase [Pseudomonadota bacterium]
MPSQEYLQMLEFIKSMPDSSGLSMEERRAGMEAGVAQLPAAEGVAFEPVQIGEMKAEWFVPSETAGDAVILYLHGGGYCLGSIETHRSLVSFMAKTAKVKALVIDYRLAPENPFPAAVEDAVAAYRWLLAQGVSPKNLTIAGDSAGGGLTVATLVDLKNKGEALPACAVCLSPWVDLEGLGESMTTKAKEDPMVQKDSLLEMAQVYLGDANAKTPLAAPLYADLSGLPPMLIQVGTAETLLDDANRLARRAKEAGVEVVLESWQEMFHVWQVMVSMVPESKDAVDGIAGFIEKHVARS